MDTNIIYHNDLIKIEIELHEIPWLKVVTQKDIKEFSACDTQTKNEIWRCLDIIEKEMLEYFQADKINIASFGNYVPHVHFHIQARFKNDSYFPEPTWGIKQRNA
ncbi:MAG: HIT domain-containing protein, partial [Arcobacteraceae bacterium]